MEKEEIRVTPAALRAAFEGNAENFLTAILPGGIEAQEARGQQELINNDELPKDMLHGTTREKLEKMGIVFGEDVDDLFISCKLPEGWKKVSTGHSMWSDLVDDKGRVRAHIFYKAAFYDRKAHISLCRRYSASYEPEDEYKSNMSYEDRDRGNWYGIVKDGDMVIYKTESVLGASYDEKDMLADMATSWLIKEYPNWEDELAYWD